MGYVHLIHDVYWHLDYRKLEYDVILYLDVPELISSSESQINFTRDSVQPSLQCEFYGVPKPQVSWYFNDELIPDDSSKYSFNNSYSLVDGFWSSQSQLLFSGNLQFSNCLWILQKCFPINYKVKFLVSIISYEIFLNFRLQ